MAALKYLTPYIFWVATSNNRILKLEDGQITFRYIASDTGKTGHCTVAAEQFIRRFLQHVLPKVWQGNGDDPDAPSKTLSITLRGTYMDSISAHCFTRGKCTVGFTLSAPD